MRKILITLLIVLGLALLVAAFSVQAFPQWLGVPGGILALIVAAFLGVAELGGKLKDWQEFLFPAAKEKTTEKAPPRRRPAERSQEMAGSEQGRQEMRGRGGVQKQKMTDSPGGQQKMD